MKPFNVVKRYAASSGSAVKNLAPKAGDLVGKSVVVAGTAMALASGAKADPTTFSLDVSSVVTVISNGVTALSAIGLAVLSLVVVIKMFKWAQRSL